MSAVCGPIVSGVPAMEKSGLCVLSPTISAAGLGGSAYVALAISVAIGGASALWLVGGVAGSAGVVGAGASSVRAGWGVAVVVGSSVVVK